MLASFPPVFADVIRLTVSPLYNGPVNNVGDAVVAAGRDVVANVPHTENSTFFRQIAEMYAFVSQALMYHIDIMTAVL